MTSQLVVDAVEQAIWSRRRESKDLAGLIAHHDHSVQLLSVAYSERLDTVADLFDEATDSQTTPEFVQTGSMQNPTG